MRDRVDGFSLDEEGFVLAQAPTAVKDFHDAGEVERVYGAEAIALVRRVTGCDAAAVSSRGVVRVSRRAAVRPPGATHTGDFAHADYSLSSAASFLRRAPPPEEAEARLKQRWAMFNVWRAFSPPPQDFPLALCDCRSVAPADIQHCTLTLPLPGGPVTWENTAYKFSPAHRWRYCSDMGRDEALVFRSYDSRPGFTVHTPHTAFADPTCPDSAVPRASLEIRMLAFWED
jgi:hypothetical protein